jgi:RNA polymerase sigma-70 factor (ECF subfamily)
MSAKDQTTMLQGYIDKMLEGDDSYRQLLVEHAYGRLRLLVKKRMSLFPGVQRWEQTDDVLQDASLRLLKSLEAVKPRTVRDFFGLAATQIRRTLIDLARHYGGKQGMGAKHATNERRGNKGREQPDTPDATGDAETLTEWTEFHQKVEELPKEQREVFDLLYYHGVTQPEAAQMLGMSERTLKRRWRETRAAMYKAVHGSE